MILANDTPVAALLIYLSECWLRKGGAFITRYQSNAGPETVLPFSGLAGFSYPWILGVLSIVVSFGKGLVFYFPGAFLPSEKVLKPAEAELREWHLLCLLFIGGMICVYAKWWAWHGDDFWGPRYFVMASIPAAFALAVLSDRAQSTRIALATLLALTLSSWIGLCGFLFGNNDMSVCFSNQREMQFLCWYVPQFSALVRPFLSWHTFTNWQLVFIVLNLGVYAYLAAPLIALLWRSLSTASRRACKQVPAWKF